MTPLKSAGDPRHLGRSAGLRSLSPGALTLSPTTLSTTLTGWYGHALRLTSKFHTLVIVVSAQALVDYHEHPERL
jgi:hypothetical protein